MNDRYRSIRSLIVICGVLATLLLLTSTPVQAQGQGADFVFVGVPGVTLGPGEEFDVTVQIAAAVDVNSAQVALDFDPAVLEVVEPIVAGSTLVPFGVPPTIDNINGIVAYAGLSFVGPVSGNFDLVTITFRTLDTGTTSLTHRTNTSNPPVSEIAGPDGLISGAREPSAPIVVDATVAITLGWFSAERSDHEVVFQWQTATESNTAGFNILALKGNELQPLNTSLIPSKVIDSVEPTDYRFTAVTDATSFLLQEVEIYGVRNHKGPFELGVEYGSYAAGEANEHQIWLPLIQR